MSAIWIKYSQVVWAQPSSGQANKGHGSKRVAWWPGVVLAGMSVSVSASASLYVSLYVSVYVSLYMCLSLSASTPVLTYVSTPMSCVSKRGSSLPLFTCYSQMHASLTCYFQTHASFRSRHQSCARSYQCVSHTTSVENCSEQASSKVQRLCQSQWYVLIHMSYMLCCLFSIPCISVAFFLL
jgi:hypothetical protein